MRAWIPTLLLLLVTAAPTARAAELLRGPYLQQVTPTSAIVVFELDEEMEAEVRFGPTEDLDGSVESELAAYHHELPLEDLIPDSTVHYSVYVDDEPVSYGHRFNTSPPDGEPFRFVVFGDTRSDHDAHREVMAAIGLEDFDALVHTGDLTSRGTDVVEYDDFFEIEGPVIDRVPLYPVVGNHDDGEGDAAMFGESFALPDEELYYSFDLGNAHFIVLDGHVNMVLACVYEEVLIDTCFDEVQLAWLEADLAEALANPSVEHVFVVNHIGPYSSKSGRTGSAHLRYLMPLFEQYGVRAILSGHDHYYERGFADNGIVYLITGGGGAPLYTIGEPTDDPHTVEYNDSINHYVMVEVDHETIRFSARDIEGVTFDELLLSVDPTDPDPPADDDDDDPPGPGVPLTDAPTGCECSVDIRSSRDGAILVLLLLTAIALRRTRT